MDRLETLLSETLTERAHQAPPGPVPLVERSHRGRNAIAVLAAASIVIALVAIIAVLRESAPSHPTTQRSQPATLPPIPDGLRLASFGQASVLVPADLPTRTSLCGGPVADEVVAPDGAARLCPVATLQQATHPGTVVWFSSIREASPYANISTTPAQVDGHPARRGYATNGRDLGDAISGVVVLSAQHIMVGVTAPSRREVDRLLSSIRIAQVDAFGCAATHDGATKTHAGPSDVLVPASPTVAVRCEYGTSPDVPGLLIGSYGLDTAKTSQLTAALNALVPDPCHCVHGGTPAPGHDDVLYFRYRDGSTLRISGNLGANLDTYSNETPTVANYSGSIGQLLAQLTNEH